MKHILYCLLILLLLLPTCTKYKNVPEYDIIENKKYDRPTKSQISLSVALRDTTVTDQQVKDLLHLFVESSGNLKMKHHDKPTNIYVYIYKTKEAHDADATN